MELQIGHQRQRTILVRHDRFSAVEWPIDGQCRIVPSDTNLMFLAVEVIDLVTDLRRRLGREESVKKAGRHV